MTLKEQAVINLREIKTILNDLGILFWLDGGTCLGAYRDKDFCLDDEDDIDLCTWDFNLKHVDKIINLALAQGFELTHRWELEIALTKNGSKIDLFFNRKNGQEAYTHLYDGEQICKYVVIPLHFYENLEPITFYGMKMLVPSPIEDYLSLKYGDWKTPVHRSTYLCYNEEQNKLVRDSYDL